MDTTSPSGAAMPPGSSSTAPERAASPRDTPLVVALAGNPNSGKTTVFNALAGLRRKVGNYPGVTVDRVEGSITLADGTSARAIDLPGCYGLTPRSEDERVARSVLLGDDPRVPKPDVVVPVVDASNLARNLYLVTELLETGTPAVVALNMVDVARERGTPVDPDKLADVLGIPVVPVVGRTGENITALRDALTSARPSPTVAHELAKARDALASGDFDPIALDAEARYAFCKQAALAARGGAPEKGPARSERIDRVLTNRVVGPILFLAIMGVIFMAVYAWAEPFMGWIEAATGWAQETVTGLLGPGVLRDLLVDGVIAGVGNVIIFLPQICILFLFLTILEDVGYLARAAFLIDKPMRAAGLSGKAFVPLMSSFACAIPGIMSARTIANRRDRMVTILVAPLMSCSARLPVYALVIAAFFVDHEWLVLLSMYALSVVAALGVAWVLRKTMFRGEASDFILELPPYRLPSWKNVIRTMLSKGWLFVRQAGTVILAISVVLWFLAYFPRSETVEAEAAQRVEAGESEEDVEQWQAGAQLRQSYAGQIGHFIEPAIEPLGYDWKTGIGLVASFAAREVMVSTLGIVYSVGEADEESEPLRQRLKADKKPDGTPVHTPLTSISLLVFFVLACQCMSTLAVVKRETKSWRWPIFMFVYMTALAYVGSLIVYQGGKALGLGP